MLYYSYYATLVYGVIALAVVAGGVLFSRSRGSVNRKHVAMFLALLAVAFVALYFIEATVRFAVSNFQGLLGTFFDYASDVVIAGGARFYVGLLSYALIFLPICVLLYRWLRLFFRNRKLPELTTNGIFIAVFLITGFVNIVMYTGLGLVDFKYFIMFFSLSALYAVKRLPLVPNSIKHFSMKKIPARQIFAVALALLFILKFTAYIAPALDERSPDGAAQINWISEHCIYSGSDTVSELMLSGKLMLLHCEKGHSEFNSFIFSAHYLDRLFFGNGTEFKTVNGDIRYIIMTDENMGGHFGVGNWETWSIDEKPAELISHRNDIQRIYSSADHSVWCVSD